ncbi:MAG: serine/threonine protein kinase [Candidatus Wallbacteria bacterium]|nr:serine/threonine protein kinase [Candidatus Wallbacteria bacterium]
MRDQHFIGGYCILGELGRGGSGVVYKARDPKDGRIVALKALPAGTADPKTIKRFLREANALLRLKHPNIVAVLAAGTDQGVHYYVMEHVTGHSLAARLRQCGRLSGAEAAKLFTMVARALAFIHANGLVHRDVKSANILIDQDGVAKLADFGLVRSGETTMLTGDGNVVGTPGYMAPEQVTSTDVDARADLYSLAIVLYEALTGTVPFVSTSVYKVMMSQRFERPDPPGRRCPGLEPEVSRVLMAALEKDPAARFPDVIRFADALRKAGLPVGEVADSVPESAGPEKLAPRPGAHADGSGQFAGVRPGFALLAAALIGATLFIILTREAHAPIAPAQATAPAPASSAATVLTSETDQAFRRLQLADLHYTDGLRRYRARDLDGAILALNRCVQLRSDHAAYTRALAVALTDAGRTQEARETWRLYLRQESSVAEAAVAHKVLETLDRVAAGPARKP